MGGGKYDQTVHKQINQVTQRQSSLFNEKNDQ